MREIRLSGSEGGVALTPPSLPLSGSPLDYRPAPTINQNRNAFGYTEVRANG